MLTAELVRIGGTPPDNLPKDASIDTLRLRVVRLGMNVRRHYTPEYTALRAAEKAREQIRLWRL